MVRYPGDGVDSWDIIQKPREKLRWKEHGNHMKTLNFQVVRCTQMGGLSDFQMPKPSLLSGHTYERSAIAKWLEALRNLDGIRSWEEGDVDRENESQRNLYEQRCAMCSIYKFAWSSAYGPVAPHMPLFSSLSCGTQRCPQFVFSQRLLRPEHDFLPTSVNLNAVHQRRYNH